MKPKKLTMRLLKSEGQKHGVNVADMGEVIGCLAEEMFEMGFVEWAKTTQELMALGQTRWIQKNTKRKGKRK